MRIAIVDDDSSVRKALRRLLESSNYSADTFASGKEFLAALHHTAIDCVVIDLKMPDIGGLELLRALTERRPSVPVIVMSAFDTPKSRSDCKMLGAVAYLPKPFEESALLSAIGAAVGGAKAKPSKEASEG